MFDNGFEHLFQRFVENEHASLQMELYPTCQHRVFHGDFGHDIERTHRECICFCQDSDGSFSIRGALPSADGDIAISSSKEVVKCCVGSKPWMLVALHA